METKTFIKTYGVSKLQNGRYAITIDVDPVKKYAHICYDVHYAKLAFAIQKADSFVRSMHKNFISNDTTKVVFIFNNVGLINF